MHRNPELPIAGQRVTLSRTESTEGIEMRYLMVGLALGALSAAAMAQESAWGFFGGPGMASGAGVQSSDGSQLLIKCDKPGKHSVFGVVVATTNLAAPLPATKFESQPVTVRMDSTAPWDENWRFNDKFAMAVDQGNVRSLTHLLQKMASAKTMTIQLKPLQHSIYYTSFNVSGAKAAIDKVYSDCGDTNPLS
jgi:hypothetical protein